MTSAKPFCTAIARNKLCFNLIYLSYETIYPLPNRHLENQNLQSLLWNIRQPPKSSGQRQIQRPFWPQLKGSHRRSNPKYFRGNLEVNLIIMYI